MSYTPTEWKNGDIISAEKMNKIQEGIENLSIGSSGGGVEIYDAAFTQNAVTVPGLTYRDVRQKMNEGKLIILRGRDATTESSVSFHIVVSFSVSGDPEHYGVNSITFKGQISFTGENLDDELAIYRD